MAMNMNIEYVNGNNKSINIRCFSISCIFLEIPLLFYLSN